MRRYIPMALDLWRLIAFALWLGGLSIIWMVLSPALHAVPTASHAAAQMLFNEVLRRFGAVCEVCGIIIAAEQWVMRRRYRSTRNRFVADGARTLLIFGALFSAEFSRYIQLPALLKGDAANALPALSLSASVQAAMLIGYAAITSWLQHPAPGADRSSASEAGRAGRQSDATLAEKRASPQPARSANPGSPRRRR